MPGVLGQLKPAPVAFPSLTHVALTLWVWSDRLLFRAYERIGANNDLVEGFAKAGVCTMQAAAAQQEGDLTSRTQAELRSPGFGAKWYIALGAACRMYGVPTLAERDGSRYHTALFDAEMAGRLYFAMRGTCYREPVKRVLRRLH